MIHEVNKLYKHENGIRMWHLLHEVLTKTTMVQLIMLSLLFTLVHEVLIVTIPYFQHSCSYKLD